MRTLIVLLALAEILSGARIHYVAAQEATGAIVGRVSYAGIPKNFYQGSVVVLPADTPQPIPIEKAAPFFVQPDRNGYFAASGLIPGEYLVGFTHVNAEFVPSLSFDEWIVIEGPDLNLPALRVSVQAGETVNINVVIELPTPVGQVLGTPTHQVPGTTPSPVSLPTTGAEGHGDDTGYVAVIAGVGVAALLALAGGVALRVRRARQAG